MLDIFKPAPDVKIEEERDFIAGQALASGLYPMTLKYAYLDESKPNEATKNPGGAHNVNFVFDNNGVEFKITEYVTSGKAKGQKTTYTNDKGTFPLPGFSKIEAFCKMFTGKSLFEQEVEEKILKLWDGKAEVKTPRKVFSDLIKVPMILGIINILEDKHNAPGETRSKNEIDKFFTEDGLTAAEVKAKAALDNPSAFKPAFKDEWLKSKDGYVKDARKNKDAKSGAPSGSAAPAAGSSLFAK